MNGLTRPFEPYKLQAYECGINHGDNKGMQLFFEVVEGEDLGAKFEIKAGLSIGRKNADIQLRDPKVSIRHATIESIGNSSLYLIDAGSSNGLKVDGLKVSQVNLVPGIRIRVGRTVIKVIELDESQVADVVPTNESWQQAIVRLARKAKQNLTSKKVSVHPFNPLIELKILQGRQAGTEWLLGYGPRQVGSKTLDLRLEEPESPDVCFEVHPSRDGAKFQTAYPDKVKLNGTSVKAGKLSDGDIIEIQTARIAVSLKADD